jgi:hypothetical protein
MTTCLYHTTTVDRADSIMLDGFRDNATVNKRLFSGTVTYKPGVWFGDVPAIDDELFDGILRHRFGTDFRESVSTLTTSSGCGFRHSLKCENTSTTSATTAPSFLSASKGY